MAPHNMLKSSNNLQRTVSDISYEFSKEEVIEEEVNNKSLPPISEVEDAKCECCGMSEEFTTEYIERVKEKYLGKWVCGLCAEAVKEELEKNGGKKEEAINAHMSACVKFNKYGRAFPVLVQAQAMKEMLKKSNKFDGRRVKSFNPRDPHHHHNNDNNKKGGLARSSSCIPQL